MTTWPPPDETLELEDAAYGRVRLQLWAALRLRVKDKNLDLTVVCSCIHTEKAKPPAAHWYSVYNGTAAPTTFAASATPWKRAGMEKRASAHQAGALSLNAQAAETGPRGCFRRLMD